MYFVDVYHCYSVPIYIDLPRCRALEDCGDREHAGTVFCGAAGRGSLLRKITQLSDTFLGPT
jgi:hypothetical protein